MSHATISASGKFLADVGLIFKAAALMANTADFVRDGPYSMQPGISGQLVCSGL